jgi:sarcosine oxidase subunit alpha
MPRVKSPPPDITVELDGQSIPAREGEPVACSLVAAGEALFARSVKYHRPRGPYCFAAACSTCLMRVDGVPNVFTCRTPAHEGMRLERQNAFPSAEVDVFAATDWIFRKGLNHHTLFAGVPVAQEVMAVVARKLAGLGRLPDAEAPERASADVQHHDVVVVGGGVSGLAASQALKERGVAHVVLEREGFTGGRAAYGAPAAEVTGEAALGHNVMALFDEEGGRFLAVLANERLLKVYAKKILFAMGAHPALPAFANNDLPGIYAGRAVARMLRRHGVLPGKRIAVTGSHGATELATLLQQAGAEPVAVGAEIEAAHGLNAVASITLSTGEKLDCDAVAVCEPPSPAFELARQGGARVVFNGAQFVVEADADGRTSHADVFVAGEQTGPCDLMRSAESGRRAALALAEGGRP